MDTGTAIREALETEFPDYCEILGPTTTKNVVRFVLAGTRPEDIAKHVKGGDDLNWLEVVQLLAAATAIAKHVLEIRKLLKEQPPQPGSQGQKESGGVQKVMDFLSAVWKKAGGP